MQSLTTHVLVLVLWNDISNCEIKIHEKKNEIKEITGTWFQKRPKYGTQTKRKSKYNW